MDISRVINYDSLRLIIEEEEKTAGETQSYYKHIDEMHQFYFKVKDGLVLLIKDEGLFKEMGSISMGPKKVRLPSSPHFVGSVSGSEQPGGSSSRYMGAPFNHQLLFTSSSPFPINKNLTNIIWHRL